MSRLRVAFAFGHRIGADNRARPHLNYAKLVSPLGVWYNLAEVTWMNNQTVAVTFLPCGITISGRTGDTVLDAALEHGIDLPHECGGNCACTTCHIRVDRGDENLSAIESVEDDRLSSADNRTPLSRLACQALLIGGPITVSLLESW